MEGDYEVRKEKLLGECVVASEVFDALPWVYMEIWTTLRSRVSGNSTT